MPPIVVGIDLASTPVRAGALTRAGGLLHTASAPIEATPGPQTGLARGGHPAAQIVIDRVAGYLAIGLINATASSSLPQPCALPRPNSATTPAWSVRATRHGGCNHQSTAQL